MSNTHHLSSCVFAAYYVNATAWALILQSLPVTAATAGACCLLPHSCHALAACRVSKFNGIYSLDLFFTGNFGADLTEIHFIGLKGDFSDVSPGNSSFPSSQKVLLLKLC